MQRNTRRDKRKTSKGKDAIFVFTDIEGSTKLCEQDAEALQNENVAYAALQMWLDEAANQLEQAEQRVAEARRLREEEAAAAAEAAAQAEAQAEGTGGDGDNEGVDE